MIEVPENLAENIEELTHQLLPALQANARRSEEMFRLYQEKPVTLQMLARGLRCSVFAAMSQLAADSDVELRCTGAAPEEITRVLEALNSGQKLIVETTALSTLLLIGDTELLSKLKGRLLVAQATLDELRAHRREVSTRGESFLGMHDGQLTMREVNPESRTRYLDHVDELLALLAECETFREERHDGIAPHDWDRLVNIGGAGAVESIHRAMRTGEAIWCDDMVLAFVAHQRGARVAWTQLLCHHLMLRSELDFDHAYRISAKLVGSRFVTTHTTQGVFREAARLAN